MKYISKYLLTCAFTLVIGVLSSEYAVADYEKIVQINSKGKKVCDEFAKSNVPHWKATVSGLTHVGSDHGGSLFSANTCFKSKKKCEVWIGRIRNIIPKIEELRHRSCKER